MNMNMLKMNKIKNLDANRLWKEKTTYIFKIKRNIFTPTHLFMTIKTKQIVFYAITYVLRAQLRLLRYLFCFLLNFFLNRTRLIMCSDFVNEFLFPFSFFLYIFFFFWQFFMNSAHGASCALSPTAITILYILKYKKILFLCLTRNNYITKKQKRFKNFIINTSIHTQFCQYFYWVVLNVFLLLNHTIFYTFTSFDSFLYNNYFLFFKSWMKFWLFSFLYFWKKSLIVDKIEKEVLLT